MQESKLLGRLLPALPELQEIAKNIRQKYNIPEVNPGEDGVTKIILADTEIDWDEVRKDIDFQVRSNPNLLPEEVRPYLELNKQKDLPNEPVITEPISDDFRANVIALYKFYVSTIKSFLPMYMPMIDQYYDTLTNVVKEYIITGKGTDVPYDWFGKVGPSSAFGEPVVFAMANKLSDQKQILADFKSEMRKRFGRQSSRISAEDLSSAEYLPLLRMGKSYKEILKIDKNLHPEKYKLNKKTHKYEPTDITQKETIRKRFQRLEAFLREIDRDR